MTADTTVLPQRASTTDVLDNAIARIEDPSVRATVLREVEALRDGRKFGLVFNRHLPESVRLPGHPVKRGVKVALRNPQVAAKAEKDATWRVTRTAKAETGERVAFLTPVGTAPTLDTPRLVSDLVVVRDFGEPVYPGLRSVERIESGPADAPFHTVINGENFHALQALQMTHRGQVDLIYIDPPYNTGNQGWIYNDKYVDTAKGDASSKWLSFMERRLAIARDLLKDTGVIIVAIGDDEHHRLRMLLDQVFGAQNFLANLTWQGGISALAKHTGGGVDYMLVFARDRDRHTDTTGQWRTPKEGADEVLAVGRRAWDDSGHDPEVATNALRDWWRPNKKRFDSGVSAYDRIDHTGRIYFAGDLANGMPRPNLQYDVPHPVTGKPVRRPDNGWRHEPEKMAENIQAGLVVFGPDEKTIPTLKRYLDDYVTQVPAPVLYKDRRASTLHLAKILGDKRFPNPKDHTVLMRWFQTIAPTDGVILDFFGGSGTTAEAVMRLNAEDDGTRQAILVTNNELGAKDAKALTKDGYAPGDPEWEARGVFEHVTRPRISTVVTGTRPDGSTYSEGLTANVEFFDLTYLDEASVSRAKEFEAIAPLLWLQTGAVGDQIATEAAEGWALTDRYGVLFTEDATGPFVKALAQQALAGDGPTHVFVVTDSPSHFEHVAGRLPAGVRAVRLYESYLRNFEINVEGER